MNVAETLDCMRHIDGYEILRVQQKMELMDQLSFKYLLRGAPFMLLNGNIADLKKNTSVSSRKEK